MQTYSTMRTAYEARMAAHADRQGPFAGGCAWVRGQYVPAEEDEEGRAIGPPIYAPDISLTSLGPGGSSYFVHAKDFCEVKVTLEELAGL